MCYRRRCINYHFTVFVWDTLVNIGWLVGRSTCGQTGWLANRLADAYEHCMSVVINKLIFRNGGITKKIYGTHMVNDPFCFQKVNKTLPCVMQYSKAQPLFSRGHSQQKSPLAITVLTLLNVDYLELWVPCGGEQLISKCKSSWPNMACVHDGIKP